MAKTTKGNGKNRSDAIREIFARNPKATSKEVMAELAKQGMKVSATLVYYVKSKKDRANRREKRERAVESSREAGVLNPVALVIKVKDLALELGGMKQLKKLVDLMAE